MQPSQHAFFGLVFSLALLLLFPQIGIIGAALIFASSVLIDVDHYIWYIFRKKDYSLKHAYDWHVRMEKKYFSLPKKKRNRVRGSFCFLHGVEIIILLFLLSIWSKIFFYIAIGFSFHILLDIISGISYHERIDRFSGIHDFLKFKKLIFVEEK